jgi:hypothetical protein
MSAPHRAVAMRVLTSGAALRSREGQFLGGIAFSDDPLTEKQANWLDILIKRHLPGEEETDV